MATATSTELTLNLPAMQEELELLHTAADASFSEGQLATPEQVKPLRSVILEAEELVAKLKGIHGRSVTFNRGQDS